MKTLSRLRALLFAVAIAVPLLVLNAPQAKAGIFVSVNFAPPVLPVYVQPALPAPGYIWTPGYWAYGDAGYYWVPGVWVEPPTAGLLWTPGYWGWSGGAYVFNAGYWGPHVGFYGGINYGFGYGGIGFVGGEWRGGVFAYNSACANFGGVHVTNVYVNRTIIQQNTIVNRGHYSFNGPGGINRQPSAQETQYSHENHTQPTSVQAQHQTYASQDRSQLASVNHGHPATMASSKPEAYHQVAEQHAQAHPITAADRTAGTHANNNQRTTAANQHPNNTPASRTAAPARNENRSATEPRTETQPRKAATPPATATRPRTETEPRTASQPRTETTPRTTTPPRTATAELKPGIQPRETQPRTATPPRTATTEPRPGTKPETEPRETQSRPTTPPRTATTKPRTEAEPRTTTPPRTAESKPAQSHPAASKPAAPAKQPVSHPQSHPAPAAHPTEQPRAAAPAPRPKEGPKPGGR